MRHALRQRLHRCAQTGGWRLANRGCSADLGVVTSPVDDAAAVRVFPPAVPLLTILAGVALNRVIPLGLGLERSVPARYWIGGAIVISAILGLGFYSVLLVRRSGQSENPWKPTTEILKRGPFKLTRNPMYLQMVLVCVGFAIKIGRASCRG